MRRTRLLAPLVCLASFGFGADDAGADFFCVNKEPCAGGIGANFTTIQEALDEAEANGVPDTIFIDANGGTPYVESPSYTDAGESVDIIGDGIGQTIIEGTGSPSAAVTLLNANSSIEDLTIRLADVGNGSALRWNGTASNIQAVQVGSSTETLGMVAEGDAELEESSVSVKNGRLMDLANATGVVIRDSTLSGAGVGIDGTGGEVLTLERSTVVANASPIQTGGAGSSLVVKNAVLRMTGSKLGDGAISALSGATVLARHVTMIGAGAGEGAGVNADANSSPTTVTIFDSIIDNFKYALRCFGEGANKTTLGISFSNWTEETQVTDPECEDTIGAGNKEIDPVFVSTNPLFLNFRLRAPSPLMDAAEPADPLTEDLVGDPRVVDGDGVEGARSDMGAYEYQRQAPSAVLSAPATATIGQPASFSAAGSSDPDPGDALTFSWNFGDGGTAEGFAPEHTFAKAGTYEVELTVTDPTGLSDSASAQVEVPNTAPAKPKGTGKESKPKNPKAVPTITELRAVPKRMKRGKGLPKLVKGLKRPGFHFKLSKKTDVTLTLVRCKGKRGCKKRVRIPGSAGFKAFAGDDTIKFRGRLTGPKLRQGRYRATLKAAGGNAVSTPFTLLP